MPRPISSRMTSARVAGLVQDRRGLDHLDHEGRAPARQVVGGADPAEELVDDADPRLARRHERAHLRQHRDQRVLPQEGRLAGHVRPGEQPERPRARPVGAELAVVGDEAAARAPQRRLDHRVPAAGDREGAVLVDLRPHPVLGRARGRPAPPRRRSRPAPSPPPPSGPARSSTAARRSPKTAPLDLERMAAGVEDLRLDLGQRQRGEADRVRRGLAVHEGLGERRLQHPLGVGRRGLDEVAEHVVVADLQRVDPGLPHVVGLQPGDHRRAPRRAAAGSRRARRRSPARRSRRRAASSGGSATSAASSSPTSASCPASAARAAASTSGSSPASSACSPRRLRQRVAHRREVARPAAVEREPRQRPLEVGHPAQQRRGPRAPRSGRFVEAPRPRRPAPGSAATSVEGAVSRVSSSRAPPPVTVRSIAASSDALAAAGEAARQLEVAPGRGVDLHQPAGALAHRRPQQRHPAALGQLEVVDDRAERRRARPGRTRRSRRASRTPNAAATRASAAVESKLARASGVATAPASATSVAQLGLERVGDQHLARRRAAPASARARPAGRA